MVKTGVFDERMDEETLIELKDAFEESPICHVDNELIAHLAGLITNKIPSSKV